MTKQKEDKKKFCVTVGDREIVPFEGCAFCLPENDLPPGVQSMSTIQIAFTVPGEHIWGRYIGSEVVKSQNPNEKDYMFHTFEMTNGSLVGFCGSAQVDRTLSMINNDSTDIHIMYAGDKTLPGKRTLKQYHIFKREHKLDTHRRPDGSWNYNKESDSEESE